MEVLVPSPPPPPPPMDFNFHSANSSPYTTAPSSPQRVNTSFSSSTIPFNWEEKPGTPKANIKEKEVPRDDFEEEFEFEFDFSGQLDRVSLSADELFDKGRIRPLKPPPGYYEHSSTSQSSSPKSPSSRSLLGKKKGFEFDPFQAALEETRREERGRETIRTSSVRKKGTSRSLSPLRVTDIMFDEKFTTTSTTKPSSSIFSALSFSSYRKWKLKDLLLFRSASEGSGSTRISTDGSREGSVGKYVVLSKKEMAARDDIKSSSSRSSEGSVGGVSRRRLSSAELHYTANRAVAEEMRRKTPLPYKQGLLGCLGFNYRSPSVHELSRGIGSLARGR